MCVYIIPTQQEKKGFPLNSTPTKRFRKTALTYLLLSLVSRVYNFVEASRQPLFLNTKYIFFFLIFSITRKI